MLTLAVDTAAHLCAACIYDPVRDAVIGRTVEDIGRGHAECLFAVIAQTLDQASLSYRDLERLGVCTGPGSFTGVRVGVAAMRGLSLALSIPVVPVTLFDAFAMSAPRGKPLLVLLDARRGEVYAQLYDAKGNADGPPAVLSVEAARQVALQSAATLTGSGAPLLFDAGAAKARIVDDAPTSDIETIARLAARAGEQAGPPVPLYLRSADAKPQSGFAVERRGDRS